MQRKKFSIVTVGLIGTILGTFLYSYWWVGDFDIVGLFIAPFFGLFIGIVSVLLVRDLFNRAQVKDAGGDKLLIDYIRKVRSAGHSDENIRKILLERGYQVDSVDKVFHNRISLPVQRLYGRKALIFASIQVVIGWAPLGFGLSIFLVPLSLFYVFKSFSREQGRLRMYASISLGLVILFVIFHLLDFFVFNLLGTAEFLIESLENFD